MRTKLFALLALAAILASACAPAATPAPVATEPPPAATQAPAATEPPAQPVTLKIYLLDYTPDTITWLENEINPAFVDGLIEHFQEDVQSRLRRLS